MDLRPTRFDMAPEATAPAELSGELLVLLAGTGARQAASATARAQAALRPLGPAPLLAPGDGAFNGGVARDLSARRDRPFAGRDGTEPR